jgi:rhomboid protease GluP
MRRGGPGRVAGGQRARLRVDLSNLLLWLGGASLAVVVLQALQGPSRDRAGHLARVVAIALATYLVYRTLPEYSGYALVLLILLVYVAPRLANRRVVTAFEAGLYQRSWRWTYVFQVLMPTPSVREGMRLMRAQIRYHLDPEADEAVLGAELTPLQRLLLHITILSYRCRWSELDAALDALPETYAALPQFLLMRMRSRYECGDLPALPALYRLQSQAAAHPALKRQADQGRVFLLTITGCVEPSMHLATHLGFSPTDLASNQATVQWCAGQEASARALLGTLEHAPDPKHRIRASYRLSHPPPPASSLPVELMELSAQQAATTPAARRARTPAVTALLAANILMFLITVGLGMVYSQQDLQSDPHGRGDLGYEHALVTLGAFIPSLFLQSHQAWRLVSALFLHGGLFHIAMNMLGLKTLGPAVERRLGWRRFVALYLISGVIGNLVFMAAASIQGHDAVLIGASGSIMGIVGAMLYESLADWRAGRQGADRLRVLVLQVVLQVLFDSSHPEVAATAHLGGLVSGFLLAILLMRSASEPAPAPAPSQAST